MNSGVQMALWVGFASMGVACSKPTLREWRPSDHQPVQSQTAQTDQAEPQDPPEQRGAPSARAAAALWAMSCAPCHGERGQGDGAERPPGARMADFSQPSWQASITDAQIATVITAGRGMMPAFAQKIRPEGVQALTQHIRALSDASETRPSSPTSNTKVPR